MTLLITCNFYFFLCNISHFFCTLSLLCEVFTRASFLKNTLNVPVSANLPFVILMKAAQSDRNVDRKTTEWRLVLGLIKKKTLADEAASSLKHTIASTTVAVGHGRCDVFQGSGIKTVKKQAAQGKIQQSVNKYSKVSTKITVHTIALEERR